MVEAPEQQGRAGFGLAQEELALCSVPGDQSLDSVFKFRMRQWGVMGDGTGGVQLGLGVSLLLSLTPDLVIE